MRDIGIRIQRYKLSRFRPANGLSERAKLGLAVGVALWLIWVVFLSDRSLVRIVALEQKRRAAVERLAAAENEVRERVRDLKHSKSPDVARRVLHERHNFAREDEVLYVIQGAGSVEEEAEEDRRRDPGAARRGQLQRGVQSSVPKSVPRQR